MSIVARDLDLYGILQVDPTAHPSVIQAAYRALARLLHPDNSRSADTARAMARVNQAYAILRDPAARAEYDKGRPPRFPSRAAGTDTVPPPVTDDALTGTVLSAGRYRGWTLDQIATHDREYLLWLRQHSSGLRYRREIDEILAEAA